MTDLPPHKKAALDTAIAALKAEGGTRGYHGWRCEYPDRYGECDCDEQVARDVLAAVLPAYEQAIRADQNDRIAQAIEAQLDIGDDDYTDAARLARGASTEGASE